MGDARVPVDDGVQSTLQDLWNTPVGRRWVLKAGLGSAVAAAGLLSNPLAAAARAATITAAGELQFVLGHLRGVTDLVLVANGAKHPLKRHNSTSRKQLQAKGGLWGAMDLTQLSHYVSGVQLPAERGMLLSVHGRRGKREVIVAHVWHAPAQATLALAKTAHRLKGSVRGMVGSPQRLQALGLSAAQVNSPARVAQLDSVADTHQTATALTMLHPNVATIDKTSVAATKSLLGQTAAVGALSTAIGRLQANGRDFATMVPATDANGKASQIKVGNITTGFSTVHLNQDNTFRSALHSGVSAGISAVRDDSGLGAVIDKPLAKDAGASTKTWVQPQGVIPQPQTYTPAPKGAGVDIKVKNTGNLFGTQTVVTGAYQSGRVPLTLYNNWVRWTWVYVQYLGNGGKNLSLNPGAKWPDTKYAQSLGVLPQVFTVLGVPLWDTNTINVDLNFPKGAHSARIMYCGLGSNLLDGGWRQYFPPEAYPGAIAPTDEVLFPALVTGLLTIGLNVFALATDIDIAVAWKGVKDLIDGDLEASAAAVKSAIQGVQALTAAESLAASVAAGGATYTSIASNGGSTENIWSILLRLASVIPKLIFGVQIGVFARIAVELVSLEAATHIVEAIPLIGEVLAVVEVAGDVATLAEVCAETIVAPWVIENEVSLSYQSQVTVSRDQRAATFPVTARTWRLDAQIDGSLGLDPVVGTINEGGRTRSDALTIDLTVPFGGSRIQFSIVFLDAAGNQVGTGVSAVYANDDPSNTPSSVAFSITQLPATISSSTVFKRADTTAYSVADGGYTWSDAVSDTGTLPASAIQELTGAAIATRLGVAGMVWKQNNRYWIRGVPVAQNGATIKLGRAQKEGYARRPFLLLDSFVDKRDIGNHVLLEPDETTNGYHVRKLTLDPQSGTLTWNPDESHGQFTLPVSAAALHSSGRVVAVHTDSGRLAWLQPVMTPRPQLASYSAGNGTQIGLLQSPVSLAVTNPGIVLILEAGAAQLSAFDLNGNPVAYFNPQATSRRASARRRRLGASGTGQYTMPLVSSGTHLDLAVDGANQIYVLYFTNDGSHPSDYHIDVYLADGTPLDTQSPGTNVGKLAVDYWRSIYGPNYNPLTNLGTTTPHLDPSLGVTEPSLSRLDPTQPRLGRPAPSKRRRRHAKRPKSAA